MLNIDENLNWLKTSDRQEIGVYYEYFVENNYHLLTHWGWVTHIYVNKLTITASENGMPPDRRQSIIWTNTGILLIGPIMTNFYEISIGINTFPFKKILWKMSSGKWRPFCHSPYVLRVQLSGLLARLDMHMSSWQCTNSKQLSVYNGTCEEWGESFNWLN